MGIPLYL